jgi:dihydroceramidase
MHLLTTPIVYRLLTFKATPQRTRLVGAILSVIFTVVMVTHMVMDEFLLHATAFGLSIYVIATRIMKIIPQQVPDPVIEKRLRNISIMGLCKSILCFTG